MKKIPKRYLLVLSLILSLGLSGLIAPSTQLIQARVYQHRTYKHRTYQHRTHIRPVYHRAYQHRTYQKRVYRRHTYPRRTYYRRTYQHRTDQKRTHRRRFHIRRWTTHLATAVNSSASGKASSLARLNYQGSPILILDHDQPQFSRQTLSLHHGAWQHYGQLDYENRVTAANAMLNKRLMPHREREPLHVDPTGWHNKRISSGWLFNRSHLIGYQFTGQNNNWKNLMTGTRQLNDPDMSQYENQVAYYLRGTSRHYVRYRITPIFRGNELPARGVHM